MYGQRKKEKFLPFGNHLIIMNEQLKQLIRTISKGDTAAVEPFFQKPGGRKYLETITLILINALPQQYGEKEELYQGFVEVLHTMEQRIQHQKRGEKILQDIFKDV